MVGPKLSKVVLTSVFCPEKIDRIASYFHIASYFPFFLPCKRVFRRHAMLRLLYFRKKHADILHFSHNQLSCTKNRLLCLCTAVIVSPNASFLRRGPRCTTHVHPWPPNVLCRRGTLRNPLLMCLRPSSRRPHHATGISAPISEPIHLTDCPAWEPSRSHPGQPSESAFILACPPWELSRLRLSRIRAFSLGPLPSWATRKPSDTAPAVPESSLLLALPSPPRPGM